MYKACEQILILDRKLKDLKRRFQAASIDLRQASHYNLEIQIMTLEGVRRSYHRYAKLKSEEVKEMTERLYSRGADLYYVTDADE